VAAAGLDVSKTVQSAYDGIDVVLPITS